MKAWHVILLLLCMSVCFIAGRNFRLDGLVRTGIDTVIVIDTIRDSIPYPVYETIIQTVPEMFPVYITLEGGTVKEPILVPVLITQKEYRTDNYHARVSGHNQSLDSIDIFQKTAYMTKRQPARRWGVGVTAGYGIGKHGLSPYVGIGGFYRIW